MNYYIQGDAANADKIKAAFEKLGCDTTGWKFNVEGGFYYTHDGRIDLVCGKFLINLIKTHPDYQELELPVEHKFKFKVGDWIVQNDNGTVSQITKTINGKDEYGEYHAYEHTNGYFAACFENEYHLWTIQDAEDGDVLETEDYIFIFKYILHGGVHLYCHYNIDDEEFDSDIPDAIIGNIHDKGAHFQPATKEQRDLLFKKMKEAGYEWDANKKELRKIQPHYDISNFHAGMPVLVRDYDNSRWSYVQFSHYVGECRMKFNACGIPYIQCIPFNEETKHLLGTTDMPSEEYINW